jgi:hypothetical protein
VGLIRFLHHLFSPHCEHCKEEISESHVCQSCETLRNQLEISNYERRQMLDTILSFSKPKVEETTPDLSASTPVRPKVVTWSVKRQILEEEDRAKAKILRDRKSTEELEKEVLANGREVPRVAEESST